MGKRLLNKSRSVNKAYADCETDFSPGKEILRGRAVACQTGSVRQGKAAPYGGKYGRKTCAPYSRIGSKSVFRFLIVGAVNTAFGTAVMFVFYNVLHLNYWVSSASNYFFGSVLSYFLNRYFTFQNRSRGPGTVWRFAVNIAVCYALAYGAAKPIARRILSGAGRTVQENGAMLAGMCLFVVLNYLGQRFFAFRPEGEAAPRQEKKE